MYVGNRSIINFKVNESVAQDDCLVLKNIHMVIVEMVIVCKCEIEINERLVER